MHWNPSCQGNISQPRKELTILYATRTFSTVLKTARHFSLTWTQSIQYAPPSYLFLEYPLSYYNSIHPHIFQLIFPFSRPPPEPPYTSLLPLPVPHASPLSFFSVRLYARYLVRNSSPEAPQYSISPLPCRSVSIRPKYLPQHPVVVQPHLCSSLNLWAKISHLIKQRVQLYFVYFSAYL